MIKEYNEKWECWDYELCEDKATEIGDIGNYYGGLFVEESDGKYYWGIENHNGIHASEIPKYLYDTLIKYNKELKQE